MNSAESRDPERGETLLSPGAGPDAAGKNAGGPPAGSPREGDGEIVEGTLLASISAIGEVEPGGEADWSVATLHAVLRSGMPEGAGGEGEIGP
jgi:hypothetical protein